MPQSSHWTPPATPFTLANVAPLGVTSNTLRWAEQQGRITRLAHGVYLATSALAEDPRGQHLQRALAQQLRSIWAIASHETAALAWELDLARTNDAASGPVRLTRPAVPAARSASARGLTLAVRDLPAHHRMLHPSGLRVTTPARTAVDVASTADLPDALVTLDAFARMRLTELVGERGLRRAYANDRMLDRVRQPLLEACEHAATQFTRHRLAEVVPMADPRRESPAESQSFGHFVLAGFPLPRMQVRLTTPYGDAYTDFLWEEARLIGEVDGACKYTTAENLVAEKRRQEGLEQIGFLVVRWMADEIWLRPASVLQRVAVPLAAAGLL